MTDYGTIKLPRDEYERHNERRQNAGLTWAAYIDGQSPDVPNGAEVDTEALAREVSQEIDYIELANRVADEVQGRME